MNNSAFPYGAFLSHRPGWTACERRLLHFRNSQPWAALTPCSRGKHSVRTTTPPGRIFSRDGKGIVQSHRLRERQVGEVLWPIDRLAAAPADDGFRREARVFARPGPGQRAQVEVPPVQVQNVNPVPDFGTPREGQNFVDRDVPEVQSPA